MRKKFKIEPEVQLNTVFVSKLRTWQTCPRKYYWAYVRNLESKNLVLPFYMGSCFHKGVENFYQGVEPDKCLLKAKEYAEDYLTSWFIGPEEEGEIEKSNAIVQGALAAYFEVFSKDRDKWEVTFSEQSFGMQLPNIPVEFVGTVDLGFLRNEEMILMDHKLHSSIGRHTVDHLPFDLQIMNYPTLVMKATGLKVAKVIYNVIKKPHPSTRVRKDETFQDFIERLKATYMLERDQYFHREVVQAKKTRLQSAFNDFCLIAEDIFRKYDGKTSAQVLDPNNWPRNSKACFDFFKPCPYLNLCKFGDTPQDLVKFKQREGLERGEVIRKEDGAEKPGPKNSPRKRSVRPRKKN